MTREQWLAIATLLALIGLGTWGFSKFYEKRSDREWVPATGEARRNPWYAAQRLVESMGHPARTLEGVTDFDRLDRDSVYFLGAGRTSLLDEQRAALKRWVEGGGHLVMESNAFRDTDPVFDDFGVQRAAAHYGKPGEPEPADDDEDDEDDDKSHYGENPPPGPEIDAGPKAKPKKLDPKDETPYIQLTGQIGDDPHRLRLTMHGGESLAVEHPDWAITDDHATHVVHFKFGRGQVTAINDINFLHTGLIGKVDNAEFLARLVDLSPGATALFQQQGPVSLMRWLIRNAWPTVAMTALLLVFWLWRVGPRFGPIRHDGRIERSRLGDHLHASGRFLWDANERGVLAAAVRKRALDRVRRDLQGFDLLDFPERRQLLVTSLGINPADADRLLISAPTITAGEFIRLAALASHIHRSRTSIQAP